jgi:branched-chain amino acid aminotransferase
MLHERGIETIERHIELDELENFTECWLTGTAAEVTPVGRIGNYSFEVGPITKDIANSYDNIVRS